MSRETVSDSSTFNVAFGSVVCLFSPSEILVLSLCSQRKVWSKRRDNKKKVSAAHRRTKKSGTEASSEIGAAANQYVSERHIRGRGVKIQWSRVGRVSLLRRPRQRSQNISYPSLRVSGPPFLRSWAASPQLLRRALSTGRFTPEKRVLTCSEAAAIGLGKIHADPICRVVKTCYAFPATCSCLAGLLATQAASFAFSPRPRPCKSKRESLLACLLCSASVHT